MRRLGRSDGSFLTGHMWLIRIGPHGAPDTLKKTTAPQELFYVISVLLVEMGDMRDRGETTRQKSKFGSEPI